MKVVTLKIALDKPAVGLESDLGVEDIEDIVASQAGQMPVRYALSTTNDGRDLEVHGNVVQCVRVLLAAYDAMDEDAAQLVVDLSDQLENAQQYVDQAMEISKVEELLLYSPLINRATVVSDVANSGQVNKHDPLDLSVTFEDHWGNKHEEWLPHIIISHNMQEAMFRLGLVTEVARQRALNNRGPLFAKTRRVLEVAHEILKELE